MSSKSVIHYPTLKKNAQLPKLAEISQRSEVTLPPIPTGEAKSRSNFPLPEIEKEEDSLDAEWIRLQQRTIETMILKLAKGPKLKIIVGLSSKDIPEVVVSESITLMHLHTCGGTYY
jgi:hypothetical protein